MQYAQLYQIIAANGCLGRVHIPQDADRILLSWLELLGCLAGTPVDIMHSFALATWRPGCLRER